MPICGFVGSPKDCKDVLFFEAEFEEDEEVIKRGKKDQKSGQRNDQKSKEEGKEIKRKDWAKEKSERE